MWRELCSPRLSARTGVPMPPSLLSFANEKVFRTYSLASIVWFDWIVTLHKVRSRPSFPELLLELIRKPAIWELPLYRRSTASE